MQGVSSEIREPVAVLRLETGCLEVCCAPSERQATALAEADPQAELPRGASVRRVLEGIEADLGEVI